MLHWLQGTLRQRGPAQNLVEFGLIVAAVAVVGMAGLQLLGRAELRYFVPLAADLAPAAPVGSGDVVHPTSVTINCVPTTVNVGSPTTCTFGVTDAWANRRTWPQGDVQLLVNGALSGLSCVLARDTSGGDPAASKCSVAWTPTVANLQTVTVSAMYENPDGAHAAPPPPYPSQTLTIQQVVNIAFSRAPGQSTDCWNPLGVYPQPEWVEIGHPIFCHVTVTDSAGPVANTTISVSDNVGSIGGTPWYSCLGRSCAKAHTFTGNTDSNGHLTFSFRPYMDALGGNASTTFTAVSVDYPSSAPATHAVTITPPADAHEIDMVVHCLPPKPPISTSWTSNDGLSVKSDTTVAGSSSTTSVQCIVVVFDTNPTNAYSGGNLDDEDAFTPIGAVSWFDSLGNPIDDTSDKPASCQLNAGNSLGTPYLPQQVFGLPEYAASCSVLLKPPTKDKTVFANYTGDPGGAHKSGTSHAIAFDFD